MLLLQSFQEHYLIRPILSLARNYYSMRILSFPFDMHNKHLLLQLCNYANPALIEIVAGFLSAMILLSERNHLGTDSHFLIL